MSLIDLVAFRRTPLVREPFDYCIVPHFIKPEALPKIQADYPNIDQGGSFPLQSLTYGATFNATARRLTIRDPPSSPCAARFDTGTDSASDRCTS